MTREENKENALKLIEQLKNKMLELREYKSHTKLMILAEYIDTRPDPSPEAERAYRNIRDTFYFMYNPEVAGYRYDSKYEKALIDLDILAQAAGIKIDGGNHEQNHNKISRGSDTEGEAQGP